MAKVVIFGNGAGADMAYRCLTKDSIHEVVGFTVDKEYLHTNECKGLPVVAFEQVQQSFPPEKYSLFVFLGFGKMNALRASKYLEGKEKGYSFVSYVSSKSVWLEEPQIGENCLILAGQQIDLDVRIGNNVVMWSGNHIGDRTVIGNHVWLSSHVCLSGDVVVENNSFFGVNSTVCHGVTISKSSFIGAGAMISQSTVENGVYVLPATQKGPLASQRFMQMVGM